MNTQIQVMVINRTVTTLSKNLFEKAIMRQEQNYY